MKVRILKDYVYNPDAPNKCQTVGKGPIAQVIVYGASQRIVCVDKKGVVVKNFPIADNRIIIE